MKITFGKRGLSAALCLAVAAVTTPMDAGALGGFPGPGATVSGCARFNVVVRISWGKERR